MRQPHTIQPFFQVRLCDKIPPKAPVLECPSVYVSIHMYSRGAEQRTLIMEKTFQIKTPPSHTLCGFKYPNTVYKCHAPDMLHRVIIGRVQSDVPYNPFSHIRMKSGGKGKMAFIQ